MSRAGGRVARGVLARWSREPIDAVYLWIDGDDPAVRSQLRQGLAQAGPLHPEAVAARRFRDHGELRYSLRSLERCAPWIRRVHVVSPGPAPSWLDVDCERIRYVRQETIFRDDAALPVFNSSAAELQLHRIPGLSRRFVYLNDDMLFGRPVTPRTFIDRAGREIHFVEAMPLSEEGLVAEAHQFTRRLVAEQDGICVSVPASAHVPQLYDRDRLASIETRWPDPYRRTSSSTFRSSDDLSMRSAYQALLLEDDGGRPSVMRRLPPGPEYCWVQVSPEIAQTLGGLAHAAETRPRFICFNDDLGEGALADRLGAELRRCLDQLYPTPSRFER